MCPDGETTVRGVAAAEAEPALQTLIVLKHIHV